MARSSWSVFQYLGSCSTELSVRKPSTRPGFFSARKYHLQGHTGSRRLPRMAWLFSEGLDMIEVPGDHVTMWIEPHVHALRPGVAGLVRPNCLHDRPERESGVESSWPNPRRNQRRGARTRFAEKLLTEEEKARRFIRRARRTRLHRCARFSFGLVSSSCFAVEPGRMAFRAGPAWQTFRDRAAELADRSNSTYRTRVDWSHCWSASRSKTG